MGHVGEVLAQLRDKADNAVIHDDTRWIIPITTASPQGLHGVLVMPAVHVGGPSPYDQHIIARTTNLAAVAFARAETDRLLRVSASTDYLTGLMNRRAFAECVDALGQSPDRFPVSVAVRGPERLQIGQ